MTKEHSKHSNRSDPYSIFFSGRSDPVFLGCRIRIRLKHTRIRNPGSNSGIGARVNMNIIDSMLSPIDHLWEAARTFLF